jgi:hypothetical protein
VAKYVVLNLKQAAEQGLLTCHCGHPENNHFSWDDRARSCAHCLCKSYRVKTKKGCGKIIEVDAITKEDLEVAIQNDVVRAIKETA